MKRQPAGSAATRQPARDLLLASLDPNGESFAAHGATDWERIPWDWLLERARHHKIAALFAGRMEQHGFLGLVPDHARAKLEQIRELAANRTTRAAQTLKILCDLYGERSIPFLLVKGSVLAEQVYGDAHLRPFYDVDLVLHDEHMQQAEQLLIDRGYYFFRPDFLLKHLTPLPHGGPGDAGEDLEGKLRRLMRERHHHVVLVLKEDDPRLPVELHWHITKPGVLRVDRAGIWEQATSTTVSGLAVKTLNLEAMLLHTAAHAMDQSPMEFKLLHLCDVVWIIERLGDRLRTGVLQKMITEWGAEQHLRCALEAAAAIFPFRTPDADRFTGKRSRWEQGCLRLAGISHALIDRGRPQTSSGRIVSRLFRETFWDLTFRRPPRRARESVSDYIAALSARLGKQRTKDQTAVERDG